MKYFRVNQAALNTFDTDRILAYTGLHPSQVLTVCILIMMDFCLVSQGMLCEKLLLIIIFIFGVNMAA